MAARAAAPPADLDAAEKVLHGTATNDPSSFDDGCSSLDNLDDRPSAALIPYIRASASSTRTQESTTMPMIRIHHGEGPAPVGLRMTKGYNLDTGTTARGGTSVIYLFKSKNEFGAYCQQHSAFNIITGLGNRISIGVGMYNKGRLATSQQYSSLNLLHVKARMLGNFGQLPAGTGKVGVKGHRVSTADVANKMWEGANWIAKPGEKIAETALHDSRYFVVFTTAPGLTIMHQQEELEWVLTDDSHFSHGSDKVWITLGTVDTSYRNQIEGHLKNF